MRSAKRLLRSALELQNKTGYVLKLIEDVITVTYEQEQTYKEIVEKAVLKAGVEIVTIIPDEDYIEVICPVCNHIGIFHKNEIENICCEKCKEEQNERFFEFFCERKAKIAGFEISYESYEENYIEVKCLKCGRTKSCHKEELDNIECDFCKLEKVAEENGFNLKTEDDSFGEPWEEDLDSWKEKYYGEAFVLECKKCHRGHIFCAEDENLKNKIKKLICECSIIPVTNDEMSTHTYCCLKKHSIETLNELQKYSRDQLIKEKIIGVKALDEVVNLLKNNNMLLKGDKLYSCLHCGRKFVDVEGLEAKKYCEYCVEKKERLKKIKNFEITVDSPEYTFFTDGTEGFIIYATIHNKTTKPMKIKLDEFKLYHFYKEWEASNFLKGYKFEEDYVMPEVGKTVAKTWSGLKWKGIKITNGDCLNISFSNQSKKYRFEFIYKNGVFKLDDYYSY